jgi:MFS family permease
MKPRIYHGWWIVGACVLVAMTGNALGLFGAGVYLRAITASTGWPTGTVSGAVTLFYVVSAVLLIPVGSGIGRVGPRPFVATGGLAMAAGVAGMGYVSRPWHVYLLFPLMGVGWACLSTTAVATTLAPWFEKYQGRAVSIASLGASAGGMMGPPLLLLGADRIGFARTTSAAAAVALVVVLPLALFILRRRPEDMGLSPDGLPRGQEEQPRDGATWSRADALRTSALQTTMIAFGLGMSVQIGLLTHQVTLLSQSLSTDAVAATISATAIAALAGRLGLAKFADRFDARATGSIVLITAAASFCALAATRDPVVLIGASLLFGLTVGNVTTLSPIIVRREFGAASFGSVFGVASCAIQLVTALGPGFYGLLHEQSGSYREPLLVAAAMDVIAAIVILRGR